MKSKIIAALLAGLVISSVQADETPVFKTEQEKTSYIIGLQAGRNLKRGGIDVDIDLVTQGIKDGLSGANNITDDQAQKHLSSIMTDVRRKARVSADDNRLKAATFLQENKGKKDIVVLPSGVQYRVIKPGNGAKPIDSDTVVASYRGTLLNGTVFDVAEPKNPATFKMGGLIAGWREVLKLMPVGSKWELFIPPEQAYGERGSGTIGPNELLIFELELLAVKH